MNLSLFNSVAILLNTISNVFWIKSHGAFCAVPDSQTFVGKHIQALTSLLKISSKGSLFVARAESPAMPEESSAAFC